MKRIIYSIIAIVLSFLAVSGIMCVFAESYETEVPYTTYTYWENVSETRKAVKSRPMYSPNAVIDATSLKIEELSVLNDICSDKDGNIYILDNSSRIIALNKEYKLLYEIRSVLIDGKEEKFDGAKSLYVHSDGTIFLCDTDHNRVLLIDKSGIVKDFYLLPDSPLIPKNFDFRPIRVVKDSHGYVYILSDGSYYGAMLYDENKKFTGFFGANNVTTGIATKIQNVFSRMFVNNKKKSASVRTLPYCFVDIVIGKNDFIYTATGKTESNDRTGQIKKLNPGTGENILDSEEINFTDDDLNLTFDNGNPIEQNIEGLDITDDGFVFCMDSQFGRIYLYDSDCRMLSAFGGGLGTGNQKGTFSKACCITLSGSDVLVGDSLNNNITVFKPTDYGEKVMQQINLTKSGEYLKAKKGWEEILKSDRNFQPAYSGLARAYLSEGKYKQAMTLSKTGYDRDTYALAFEIYRKNIIKKYFWTFLVGFIFVVSAVVAILVIFKKKKQNNRKSENDFKLLIKTPFHPVVCFENIKEKSAGSVKLCGVVLVLFYVTAVLQVLCGGFLFTQYDRETFNSLWVLIRSVGIVVCWIASNWLICTLLQGKGKLKEIIVVTCYSLTPIIFARLIRLVLSNVLLPAEAVFLSGLDTIALLYTFLLLIIGLIKIHDFSMSRLIGTTVLSVFAMAAIIFLIVLVFMLIQQLGGFIGTLFVELSS